MRLICLHVENFGKLSNYDLDFEEGLNTVLQENGWGKSTLAAFLRAMFYGLDGERKRGFTENERLRYEPWNKGPFGGSIVFESNGKRYLATRNFGRKEKDATFKLQDAVTLLESRDFTEKLGEELFGIDRESFGKTSFLDEASLRYTGINSVIGSKVGAVSQADDMGNYDTAMETIKNYLNSHSPKLKKGNLFQLNEEIYNLERNLEGADTLEERAKGLKEIREREWDGLKTLKERREALQKEQQEISENKLKTINRKRLRELETLVEERSGAVETIRKEFLGKIPTKEELEELEEKLRETEQHQFRLSGFAKTGSSDRFERLQRYFRNGVPGQEVIEEQIAHCNALQGFTQSRTDLEEQEKRQRQRLEELDLDVKRMDASNALALAEKKRRRQHSVIAGILCVLSGFLLAAVSLVLKWNVLTWLGAAAFWIVGALFLLRIKMRSMAKECVPVGEEQLLQKQMEGCREELERIRTELESVELDFKELESELREFFEKMEISYSRADAESLLYEMKNRAVEYAELQREKEGEERQRAELLKKAEQANKEMEQFIVSRNIPLKPSDHEEIKKWINESNQKLVAYEAALWEEKKAENSLKAFQEEHGELKYAAGEILEEPTDRHSDGHLEEVADKRSDGNLEKPADKFSTEHLEELTEEELCAREERIRAEQLEISGMESKIHENISSYNREMEDILEKLEEMSQQKEKLEALKKTREQEMARYRLVQKTQEYLQEAKETFSARFMNPVKNAFDKYYWLMTGSKENNIGQASDIRQGNEDGEGKMAGQASGIKQGSENEQESDYGNAREFQIDANMNIFRKEEGEYRDIQAQSTGNADMIGLCIRMALLDAMYQEEKPLVIMDDPFAELDQNNLEGAKRFLRQVSQKYQILYLTCHPTRKFDRGSLIEEV